jgi:hypothetical protein
MGRAIEALAELAEIVWGAVGESMIGLRPHILGGIELRCVGREVVDSEPRMVGQKRADFAPPMDWPPIPAWRPRCWRAG